MKVFVSTLAVAAALATAGVAAAAPAAPPIKTGHYMCYLYDANGFPLLAADFWILGPGRYAGPGKKYAGTYTVGPLTVFDRARNAKGWLIRFRGGAYGGWIGYYRTAAMARGSDVIYMKNNLGFVGNGCARSS